MTTETKRKDSPEGLAGDKYFNLIEHAADGIAIIQDGVFKLVNTALTRISGYDKEELLGMPFTKLLTPQSQKLTIARYQARLAGKKVPAVYEIQAVTKNGEIRDIELNAALAEYEGHVADEVIIRDITKRKQVEDKIRRAEQEKTAILNSLSELVVYQDTEHRIIWTNTIAAESVGMTHEQLVGRHCYEIWPQRDTPCVGCPVAKARQTGKPQEAEITTPDGRVWFIRGYPTQDENGAVIGLLEVALDITDRKQAEEQLQESQKYSTSLLANSPNPISVINPDTSIRYVNPAFEKLTGYSAAELIGRKAPFPYWTEETLQEAFRSFKKAMRHGDKRAEKLFQKKNGERFWVEITSTPVKINGEFKYYLANWVDITERKQAEEALADEATRRRILIDQSRDGIVVLDQDGKVYEANQQFAEMLGYTPEEVRQLSVLDWEYLYPREQVLEMVRTVDEAGDHFETKHRRKDGSTYDVEISTNGAVVAGQKLIFCVCRDITERKQAEEALQTERNKLQSVIVAMEYDLTIQDKDFNIIYQNELSRISSGGDHVGEKCYRVYEGRDKICDGCPLEKAFKDGKSHTVERQQVSPSGEVTFFENTANPIRNAKGEIVSCLEIGRNITGRKRMEEALQESEEKFSKAFRASPEAIAIFRLKDNIIIEVNESFTRFTGYTREEVINHNVDEFNLWVYEEERARMLQIVQEQGRVYKEEFHSRMKSGEIRVGLFSGELISIHGEPCMTFVTTDITERKKREQLQHDENYVLTLLGQGANLSELLDAIVRLGEYNDPTIKGSVLLFDSSKELLFQASAPSLPDDYAELFENGVPTGPKAGSCGTAAHRKERVIVPDIAKSPLFKPVEEVIKRAVNNGLLAVWSQPIISSNGDLFGTIANYSNKVGEPSADNLRVLEWSARIAAIAIERKQAEEALRQSEKKYKNLAEATSDMIWETNERGIFTFVSPRIKDLLGYEANEVIGKMRTLDLTTKAEAQKWLKRFKEINAKKEPFFGFEIAHLHKNGTPVLFETSGIPTFDNAGNFKGYVGVNKDITERKQMEEQLREEHEQLDAQNEELRTINEELQATEEELQHSQERLERMFESVTDGISVINLNGVITKVNQRMVEIHGFASEDKMLGRNAFDLVAPRNHERIAADVRQALKEGLIIGGEYTLLKADGSEFPGEISTSVLKDSRGKAMGHISIARDITERKQAEEREKQLEQELNLAGRLASIGQLAAGVAHEINNPLTGVIGFSHLMLSRDIPDDMKQDLQVIHSEAQRVAKIVENLLVFAHQRKTGREYVAINDIITRVLELRAYEMKVNNIEVENQLDPDLPLTMADAGQLQQVFLNIVLNAEHFITKAHNKGKLLVKTEKVNGNIRASFTDDGAGISPENLDKIFNPFFTTKEVGKGTGLGLSICHGIITQHQGRIYAQSELGKGATFVIELPIVAEPVQAGKAEVTKKEPQKPRGAKILVVDDEAAILTFLSRLLTDMGHSVETINNADIALERLKTERYSLILLDIKLPGMSGIELYHHIEEIAPALARRVMFITGDVIEGATRGFMEKTGAPYITKPLDIEVLQKMLNSILTGGAQRLTV